MIITPNSLKERAFQSLIKEYLITENGYRESFNKDYNKDMAIDVKCLFTFLETTQEKAMNRLKEIYKTNYQNKILSNIVENLRVNGTIHVLKHGIRDYGVSLKLAFFKPPTDLNPEQYLLYKQNIISVTEELNYIDNKRILPIVWRK